VHTHRSRRFVRIDWYGLCSCGETQREKRIVTLLFLKHVTHYLYAQPVALGEQRIMVRPLESYDQRLLDAELTITPTPLEVRWLQDVFGNAVAIARFGKRSRELRIESTVRMEHLPVRHKDIQIESYAQRYPFTYSSEDMPDLIRSIERGHHDPERVIDDWARQFIRQKRTTETLPMLMEMTATIRREFTYFARFQKGTQTPIETIQKKQGTCRDFAVLMIEAARALGLAARFVSGYLYDPDRTIAHVGGGNTHAWVRIFMPGSGWVEFDPTNGIVGNRGLIRVAVARDPYHVVPISGTWRGFPSDNLGMNVSVEVRCEAAPEDASVPDAKTSGGQRPA
jgi:transglutaminase-like putative cysteine protease